LRGWRGWRSGLEQDCGDAVRPLSLLLFAAITATPQIAVSGVITIPYGTTSTVNNMVLPSGTTLLIRGRLLQAANGGASYLVRPASGASNVTIQCEQGGTIDGNGVVPTTGQKSLVFVDSNTNFQMKGCTFHNSGTPSNLMGALAVYNSSATIQDIHSDATLYGTSIKVDCAYSTKRIVVDGVTADGSRDNVIYVANTGATEGACNADIGHVSATNVSDYSNGDGPKGNVVVLYRADNVNVHDIYGKNVRFSCVRVNQSADGFASYVICDGSQESAGYAEFGTKRFSFDRWKILHSKSGLNLTNVEDRIPDDPNTVDGVDCVDVSYYCVASQHGIISNINSEGTPIGVLLGIAPSSHDNVLRNINCSHVDKTLPPTFACIAATRSINTGIDYVFANIARSASIAPLVSVDVPTSPVISGISKAASATVTYSRGQKPAVGSTYCFAQVSGMVGINGLCGVVSASTTSIFVIGINTTSFGSFSIPAGNSPLGVAIGVYSSGKTPMWPMSPNLHVQVNP
jgi:hypothetical protein